MPLLSAIINHRPEQITASDLARATPDDLLAAIVGIDEVLRSPSLSEGMTVDDARHMVDAMGVLYELLELAHHLAASDAPPEELNRQWQEATGKAALKLQTKEKPAASA